MKACNLPTALPDHAITALIDSREQTPLVLTGLRTTVTTLCTGDYSAKGIESVCRIERKSLPDLIACVGRERERFDREIQRLLSFPVRALVVEASWQDIEAANWRAKITTKQAGASLVSWMVRGVPVVMAGDRRRAGVIVASMLRRCVIHRWRELRVLANTIEQET